MHDRDIAMPPPLKSEEQLRKMDREELIEYALDRQQAAYSNWESMMGSDL